MCVSKMLLDENTIVIKKETNYLLLESFKLESLYKCIIQTAVRV